MTLSKTLLAGLALAVLAAAPAARAQEALGDLTLSFPGLATKSGKVMIAVYDSAQGWAAGKAVRVAMAPASDSEPSAKIPALPTGTYAVRVFQDVDGDGKMSKNPFGLPTEPYGFSRDAMGQMGPPTFDDAAFEVKAGANAQTLHLK
ncbi:DUF2141 domain-containing protein [Caulobacter segnis]|uniref:DUF2141 domain-containing protein n=2 Tax=Caulobacter segnis TaxID=88688 RepID=D5VP10_CAUST|nr:DUF2141 domain-containing protein [Caulobacter segnis]ADG12233.1 Protein of unknown function DUF2141 [Caulobacter segnis ATCC 21756]AVQ03832.1 DUF2141 domain-containing protein [Caulobacter segnis]